MTQPCAFVDPSSLSLPSSSVRRPSSPASSDDSTTSLPTDEPPRKRPRSAVTPEERKEARAHRNRIAAQNSRDRRKAQFTYLERRVAELEDENRRLRAGILVPPAAISSPSDPSVDYEQDQVRKYEEGQRERENQELRERIRTLEKGYETLAKALAAQSNLSAASNTPTSSAPSPSQPSQTSSPSSSFALPQEALDLSLANQAPTRHLARVVNTAGRSAVSLQRVGGAPMVMRPASAVKRWAMMRPRHRIQPEDEAASDADITRLFAEILASPPLGSSALPSSSALSEDAFSKEVLTKIETNLSTNGLGLGLGMSGISPVDWVGQVRAEMEMEKLLEMLPNVQDVAVDAILNSNVNVDVDMDFSSALTWDGVSVV